MVGYGKSMLSFVTGEETSPSVSLFTGEETSPRARYVILEHDWPVLHWDLMLESGDTLRTWRLDSPPDPEPVRAEASFAHRQEYLDYEGPVSNERGTVQRWDHGEFTWLLDQPDRLLVEVSGQMLRGRLDLLRNRETEWTLRYHPVSGADLIDQTAPGGSEGTPREKDSSGLDLKPL